MLRRQEMAAWRPYGSKLLPNQIDALANAVFQRFKESGAVQEQMPGRDERRRNSEEEQEQGGASQQVVLPTPGWVNHQRAVWSLTFLVFGVYLVKAEVQEDHVREVHPDRQDGFLGMRKEMKMWEDWCLK